jgi:hypothetical protein
VALYCEDSWSRRARWFITSNRQVRGFCDGMTVSQVEIPEPAYGRAAPAAATSAPAIVMPVVSKTRTPEL